MKLLSLFFLLSSLSIYGQNDVLKVGEYTGKYKARDDKGANGGVLFRNGGSGSFNMQINKSTYSFSIHNQTRQFGTYSIANNIIEIAIDSIYITKSHLIDRVSVAAYSTITMSEIHADLNRDRSQDEEYIWYNITEDKYIIKRAWYLFHGTYKIKLKGNSAIIFRNNEIGKWRMKLKPINYGRR